MIHVAMAFDGDLLTNCFALVCVDSIRRVTDETVSYHFLIDPGKCHVNYLKLMRCLISKSGGYSEVIDVSDRLANRFPFAAQWQHVSPVSFARFLVPEVVKTRGRVIYLDTDIVARRSLSIMNSEPIGGKPLGAVVDAGLTVPPEASDAQKSALSAVRSTFGTTMTDVTKPFFYSGQLIMDLSAMPYAGWMADMINGAWKRMSGSGVKSCNDEAVFNEAFVPGGFVYPLLPKYCVIASHLAGDDAARLDMLRDGYGVDYRNVDAVNKLYGTNYRSIFERVMSDAVLYHYSGPKSTAFRRAGCVSVELKERFDAAASFAMTEYGI